jgi:hypothetical protein
MHGWKKVAAAAVVVAALSGAGIAWAQEGSQPGPAPVASNDLANPGRALGGGITESNFVTINPCRLVDTRQAGGAFTPNTTRRFDVRGGGATFAAQGGKANGCGIPTSGVSGVEVTVTSVTANATGFLRLFPSSEPNATFMNYTNVFNASNTGTVAICATGCPANQDLAVKNYGGTTQVVIDVQGYYAEPMAAKINANGTIARQSRVVAAASAGTGVYTVSFDRNVSACTYSVSPDNDAGFSSGSQVMTAPVVGSPNVVLVRTKNAANASVNQSFYLEVIC